MGSETRLTVGCGLYDRTLPLANGTIRAKGLALEWSSAPPQELFNEVLKEKYAVGEMSLAYLSIVRAAGDRRFVGLPIFPSRMFRHSALYVRSDSLLTAEALRGKKIGVNSYTMTAAVWVRWLLRTEYGISPEDMTWYIGPSVVPTHSSPRASIVVGGRAELERMLLRGDLDILLSVIAPKDYAAGKLRRLWIDARAAERASAEKHGIFPIMHTLIMRRPLYEENPWIADSLFAAFSAAKELCYEQLLDTDAPRVTLPWLSGDVEEARRVLGMDYWPYGLDANRKVLTTFLDELYAEGLIGNLPAPDDIFLPLNAEPAGRAPEAKT
jgi:4,5-dihydroxyphthalate decarboxylase